jgi:LEA14-like dessication related protein
MPFCAKCGKQHGHGESFCAQCGTALKEVKEVIERTVDTVERKSHGLFIFFIIFVLIIGYAVLDVWAVSQVKPEFSLDGVISTVSNFDANVGYTSASAGTTIRVRNPTFVPILFGKLAYDAGYGDTKIVDGQTGWIVMAPYSTKDLPANVRLSYGGALKSTGKAILNLFTGKNEKLNANVYADFGITKIRVGGSE